MKRVILVQICYLVFSSFMYLNAQWAKTYGGNENDVVWSPIQQTSDGGYIVTGYTESFGAGGRDIWILKLDSNGTIEWQRTYGGSYNELANSIQQTTDGGYIAAGISFSFGSRSGDFWIVKLDSTGNIEWQRAYGGSAKDYAKSIQQTSDGGYIVEGQTSSFGSGWSDIWILKLSSVGEIEWQRTYGGSSNDYAWWIQQTSDGGYIVAGETYSFGDGSGDAWILKLSSVGDIEWQRIYGGNKQDWSSIIQQTSDGGYIVAGGGYSFGAGDRDGWILKLSSVGDIEWQRTYGGIGYDYTWHIQQTNDGGYIIAGYTFSFGKGEDDAWIFKVDTNGNIEWQRTYGGGDYDYARSIQQTSDGGYIVIGSTRSFGSGGRDIWALKLGSTGDISQSCGFIGSSTATVADTNISPEDISITPLDTAILPLATSVSPQDSDATVCLLCSAQEYALTISASSGGTTDPAPDIYMYDGGTEVTITAVPDNGYGFSEWSGDASGTENPITITVDKDKSITANFCWQYALTINAGEGGIADPAPGTHNYCAGRDVSITATPNTGYSFSGWTGDIPLGKENDNPLIITMNLDKSITANFIQPCLLTITAGEGGTTDPAPGVYTFDSGTEVSVEAKPDSGYKFNQWGIDASGTENPITITIDTDKWIAAIFATTDNEEKSDKSFWDKWECFIATAAYESPLHSHVNILRDFRDKFLMSSKFGRKLVDLYYKYSPFIANIITKHKILKAVVRIFLLPLVAFSYSMLHFGPAKTAVIIGFTFIIAIFLFSLFRKKIRPLEARQT